MSFSFSSLIRLLVLLTVGTTMMAVGLSRFDPPVPARHARRTSGLMHINEYFLDVVDLTPRWLDVDTGQIAAYPLEDGESLESSSCSPWVDENGDHQVVGRWTSRTGTGPKAMSSDFGIARYTFPGGKMVDHVSSEVVPSGPPCWYPGTGARVLFAGGDGGLYRYAFEPEPWVKAADPSAGRDSMPRPLAWRCKKPGDGNIYITDLTWPDDPRMGGCVVVSLREIGLATRGDRAFPNARLWWLKLNAAGTEIVECGRLTSPAAGLEDRLDVRCPTVGALPNGKLVVAYLQQWPGKACWELHAAPIDLDPDRRVPAADASESLTLATDCQPGCPSFSTDGRWINVISGPDVRKALIARFSTGGLVKPER